MLDLVTSKTLLERESDYRSYAGTGGIIPLKKLFAECLDLTEDEIYIGGAMSTTLMYDIVSKAVITPGVTQEDARKYSAVLCGKASLYDENLKYQNIHNYNVATKDATLVNNTRYSTGELRPHAQANISQPKEEPHIDETATNDSEETVVENHDK